MHAAREGREKFIFYSTSRWDVDMNCDDNVNIRLGMLSKAHSRDKFNEK